MTDAEEESNWWQEIECLAYSLDGQAPEDFHSEPFRLPRQHTRSAFSSAAASKY
jgi:hypothetical protein